MSKKKPRSKDPHSWIKDTTKKAVKTGPTAKGKSPADDDDETASESGVEAESSEAPPGRVVYIEYAMKDGRILVAREVLGESYGCRVAPPATLREGRAGASIVLTGQLRDKRLIELHEKYRVVISKSKPTLVPKG